MINLEKPVQKLLVGQKVFVYYNLRKHCWSVKDVKSGLVVAHVDSIQLKNAQFKVSEAGRKRVLREKQKNIHAGVQGYVTFEILGCIEQATYNPYIYDSFVNKNTGEKVVKSDYVDMISKKVYYK